MSEAVKSERTLALRAFRRDMRRPWVIGVIVGFLVAGAVLAAVWTPVGGVCVGIGGAVLFIFCVPWTRANKAGDEGFFVLYADSRGLEAPVSEGVIDVGFTPLLEKGDSNYWRFVMVGELSRGVSGALGRFTFLEHYTDSHGNEQTSSYDFTAATVRIPEAAKLPHVYCHPHIFGGGGAVNTSATSIAEKTRRVKLESDDFDGRFDLRVPEEASEGTVRELFDPVFIDWLATKPPDQFGFELCDGVLCGYVKKQYGTVEELDALKEATANVARHVFGEATEAGPQAPLPG